MKASATLVPLPDYPSTQAIAHPFPPLRVPLKGVEQRVLKAHEALAALQGRLSTVAPEQCAGLHRIPIPGGTNKASTLQAPRLAQGGFS